MSTNPFPGFHPPILCVFDFSEASQRALVWAAEEARRLSTGLTVLYPYRLHEVDRKQDIVNLRKSLDKDAIARFEQVAHVALADSPVHYDFRPEVGFVNDRVFAHSNKNEIAMLVISKRMAVNNRESILDLIDIIKYPLVIVPSSN